MDPSDSVTSDIIVSDVAGNWYTTSSSPSSHSLSQFTDTLGSHTLLLMESSCLMVFFIAC